MFGWGVHMCLWDQMDSIVISIITTKTNDEKKNLNLNPNMKCKKWPKINKNIKCAKQKCNS
jgi:hypothetical protein